MIHDVLYVHHELQIVIGANIESTRLMGERPMKQVVPSRMNCIRKSLSKIYFGVFLFFFFEKQRTYAKKQTTVEQMLDFDDVIRKTHYAFLYSSTADSIYFFEYF